MVITKCAFLTIKMIVSAAFVMMDIQEIHAVSHYNISQESFRSENKDDYMYKN